MNTDEQNNEQEAEQKVSKKRAGRPRKWPKERRIAPIYEGRMSFKPGDAHPMDAQLEQARDLREAIKGEVAELQELLSVLGELDDPSEAASLEEQSITGLLWDLYRGRKHRDHIVATFVAARRRRLLQRLQAARAALEQARAFLTTDAEILPRLQQAIRDAEASALALHGPPPSMPVRSTDETSETEAQEEEGDTQERETGEEILTAPDQEERRKEVRDAQTNERRALLRTVGGADDARATRAQLSEFEQRARIMRNAIAMGQGWFEWYYVDRPKRYTQEAAAYLQRGEEIPPDVQVYQDDDGPPWGPYLRFRMYEGGTQITIGMGHIRKRGERQRDEPPEL